MSGTPQPSATRRFGFIAAVTTTVLTVVTFALALTALPDDEPYPFANATIVAQWPGDYLWMVPAMLLMLSFVALVAAVHEHAPPHRRIFSLAGLCAAVMAATVQLANYFLQFSVMQLNLEKNQLDGWALLTQYNPNGVFIALEELAYLLMSLALLALAPVFGGGGRVEKALRWLLTLSFAGVLAALVLVSALLGMDRGDTFEIAVITTVWLTLMAAGPLMAAVFRREA
ncbi:hypothetical protein [Corynebacterium marinum]|jgi:hypothetical protein|uniref:Uncharacterized protein n=1 Tax=Corynebacterium marinum DSM 44953 TaxID=1224162 RepID=A0A0B6TIG3_9CORY|nr:hypothetical protein [Corynebacterium marinum]AJK67758.1 hypothetical protein B840_00590 [Corynebacterium marinum DSM 44953]GGO12520.1 hypothetical protein GCM10010980_04900 [Corynebacterium marinum]